MLERPAPCTPTTTRARANCRRTSSRRGILSSSNISICQFSGIASISIFCKPTSSGKRRLRFRRISTSVGGPGIASSCLEGDVAGVNNNNLRSSTRGARAATLRASAVSPQAGATRPVVLLLFCIWRAVPNQPRAMIPRENELRHPPDWNPLCSD